MQRLGLELHSSLRSELVFLRLAGRHLWRFLEGLNKVGLYPVPGTAYGYHWLLRSGLREVSLFWIASIALMEFRAHV